MPIYSLFIYINTNTHTHFLHVCLYMSVYVCIYIYINIPHKHLREILWKSWVGDEVINLYYLLEVFFFKKEMLDVDISIPDLKST